MDSAAGVAGGAGFPDAGQAIDGGSQHNRAAASHDGVCVSGGTQQITSSCKHSKAGMATAGQNTSACTHSKAGMVAAG